MRHKKQRFDEVLGLVRSVLPSKLVSSEHDRLGWELEDQLFSLKSEIRQREVVGSIELSEMDLLLDRSNE